MDITAIVKSGDFEKLRSRLADNDVLLDKLDRAIEAYGSAEADKKDVILGRIARIVAHYDELRSTTARHAENLLGRMLLRKLTCTGLRLVGTNKDGDEKSAAVVTFAPAEQARIMDVVRSMLEARLTAHEEAAKEGAAEAAGETAPSPTATAAAALLSQ